MSFVPRACVFVLGAAAFLLNPFACSSEEGYQYDAAEMRAAVEGTWRVEIHPTAGAATSFTAELRQQSSANASAAAGWGGAPGSSSPSWLRPALACGTRTLLKSAAACIDLSEMPLSVQVREGDDALKAAKATAVFTVAGWTFAQGQLALEVGPHRLFAELSPEGVVSSVTDSSEPATVTMMRLSR